MQARKLHNRGADIVPQIVEDALYFDVERTTLLKRCKVDPELREAFRAGRDRRRHRLVREFYPKNTADELELLLVDLLKEVRALRRAA